MAERWCIYNLQTDIKQCSTHYLPDRSVRLRGARIQAQWHRHSVLL